MKSHSQGKSRVKNALVFELDDRIHPQKGWEHHEIVCGKAKIMLKVAGRLLVIGVYVENSRTIQVRLVAHREKHAGMICRARQGKKARRIEHCDASCYSSVDIGSSELGARV
jgi:hypothetical protein